MRNVFFLSIAGAFYFQDLRKFPVEPPFVGANGRSPYYIWCPCVSPDFFIVLIIGIFLRSIVIPTFLFGFPTESATNV